MNLAEWLVRTAALSPASPALCRGSVVESDYRQFARRVAAIAGSLVAVHGIRPGDRVAILAKNDTRYLEALYAIWFTGAAAVPINAKLHAREAAWIVENAEASLVFTTPDPGDAAAALFPATVRAVIDFGGAAYRTMLACDPLASPMPCGCDDMAWLFYTSGTTGKPKGVMLSHGNIQAMAFSYFTDVDRVTPEDAALYAAPMSHGAGLYNVQHVLAGARHVVPDSGGFDPAEILDIAPGLGNVHLFAAPTMVRRLVDRAGSRDRPGEGIRTIVYGGGPMYLADIVEAVDRMGPRFCQIYGQGESPMAITALPRHMVADREHPRWRERLASVGVAQSCVEVRVADAQGQALPGGETGEVLVRGAPVMAGYWRNAEASAAALRGGWLWTGDIGALDADGFLTLLDRSKDVIISGGANIYPREVEEALLTHPGVHEASVVGSADPEWGETVTAFVVASAGATLTEAELDRHCQDSIARFKRPKTYVFVDRLPKNNYGKVLKTELRDRLKLKTSQRVG